AAYQIELPARESGYVAQLAAERIGLAAMKLGAGRATKDDVIDLAVGIVLRKKVGDPVAQGEPLAVIHANRDDVEEVVQLLHASITITGDPIRPPALVHEII